ncbi:MAG: hypothetical protein WCK65_00045 [Rhodospirillaceae bacterium]
MSDIVLSVAAASLADLQIGFLMRNEMAWSGYAAAGDDEAIRDRFQKAMMSTLETLVTAGGGDPVGLVGGNRQRAGVPAHYNRARRADISAMRDLFGQIVPLGSHVSDSACHVSVWQHSLTGYL